MSPGVKLYLVGAYNAFISGAAVGITGTVLNIGFKKAAIMVAVSGLISLAKWVVQHPIEYKPPVVVIDPTYTNNPMNTNPNVTPQKGA